MSRWQGAKLAGPLGVVGLALALPFAAASGEAAAATGGSPTAGGYRSDFQAFCRQVEEHYAYFDARETDWGAACVRDAAGPRTPGSAVEDHQG